METGSIFLIVVLAAVVLLVFYGIAVYNGLVSGRNQVEAAWGQIDVQLKRRHDLIPNLVEVAKDYMDYEQETLQQVIQARNSAVAAEGQSRESAIGAEGMLGAALGRLFALVENYPDLKANENVQRLMEELATTENRIAFSRQHYNDSVLSLNTKVESFPSNIVANSFGFVRAPYFDVPEAETEPVKVDLR